MKLFNNLIKAYHDGLMISTADDLIFYNNQIPSMFNLSSQMPQMPDLGYEAKPEELIDLNHKFLDQKKKVICNAMMNCFPLNENSSS